MFFEEEYCYHVYNRGNNLQKIFFHEENFIYFLEKVKNTLVPACNLLAFCLLPNHFHLLIQTTYDSCIPFHTKMGKELKEQNLTKRIGQVLGSYTQGINKRYNRIGGLFQPKTKAKCLNKEYSKVDYLAICFQYIHQNPVEAGLVDNLEDWPYSSFLEYLYNPEDGLCNRYLAKEIIKLDWNNFYGQSKCLLDIKDTSAIF